MQAAERRIRDEKSCASGPEAQREAEKASKESKVIDLTLDDNEDDHHMYDFDSDSDMVIVVEDIDRKPPSSSTIAGPPPPPAVPQRRSNSNTNNKSNINNDANPSSKTSVRKTDSGPQAQLLVVEWSCRACTLLNPYISLRCEVCDMRRPF